MAKHITQPSRAVRLTPSQKRDALLKRQPDSYIDPARRHRPHAKKQFVDTEPKRNPHAKKVIRNGYGMKDIVTEELPHGERALTVPRHARLGIMFMALQEGVAPVARRFKLREDTVYLWFKEEGGIQEVREYLSARASAAFHRMIAANCDALVTRMETAADEEVFGLGRKMLEVGGPIGLSGRKAGDESENSPQHPPGGNVPSIILQFNSPPSLPSPSSGQLAEGAKIDTKSPDSQEIIEGEVTDIFDE